MSVLGATCKDNPSEGVSSIPLNTVPGTPVDKTPDKTAASPAPPAAAKDAGSLYVGEYACYGAGNRLMAGMGFHLKAGNKYEDGDGGRGGTYTYNAGASTISFKGGFLDGQAGRNVRATGFALSASVSCEPWR
jgi:hypothetical protein